MTARTILYLAFLCSGAAGLVYEVVWSRYLSLFLGHSAEAQVLVIAMFLGGLSVGAFLVGPRSRRLARPLEVYALVELGLAAVGLSFHAVFEGITGAAYTHWFPALESLLLIAGLKWVVAALLVFLPSILLGATFPLVAAGLTRADPGRPGREVGALYCVNSLGGALAVPVAGFALVPALGLQGTLATAGGLNLIAALGAWIAAPRLVAGRGTAARPATGPGLTGGLWRLLLATSALTAVASFAYQIGWIRMLSLVMGSATHSFEIMLSAFILGLAIGAWAVRRAADRVSDPVRLLGGIQWLMGLAALATLPVYVASFGWMGDLVSGLSGTADGYAVFGAARYAIALAVMLPSTALAGATLPLITATLLRGGAGERAIGLVYGTNTAGAIAGVMLAGLVLLPALGLEGLLVAGAVVDIGLGVALLAARGRGTAVGAAAVAAGAVILSAVGVRLDRSLLTGGTFRYGRVDPGSTEVLYYADGRTATVGVHRTGSDGLIVLTVNGKPDASLTTRWLAAAGTAASPAPIRQQDESTQMLTAVVASAHAPGARRAAVIGHGSGVSTHFLLTDAGLDSVLTVEIEPRVVDASALLYPANRNVFDDPRSRIAIADAKSYFARDDRRFDLILSEPSNPWVSGTASLFSVEFYRRIRGHLSENGVFAQWFHLYETDDALVRSVIAAIDRAFPSYRGYLVGDSDVMIVAGVGPELPEPEWDLLSTPAFRNATRHIPTLEGDHLAGLLLFTGREMGPLVRHVPPNSDYRPILDVRSERTRFDDSFADGAFGLASDRFRVAAALGGWRLDPAGIPSLPIPGLAPMRDRAHAVEARVWLTRPDAPIAPGARRAARRLAAAFSTLLAPPTSSDDPAWADWVSAFLATDALLHGGTAGFADRAFFDRLRGALADVEPPREVEALIDFVEGAAAWRFDLAAAASGPVIEAATGRGRPAATLGSLDPGFLLDAAVVSRLAVGDTAGAASAYEALAPRTGRAPGDLRNALLEAHLGRGGGSVGRR